MDDTQEHRGLATRLMPGPDNSFQLMMLDRVSSKVYSRPMNDALVGAAGVVLPKLDVDFSPQSEYHSNIDWDVTSL